MKRLFLSLLTIWAALQLFAYQHAAFSLGTPTKLYNGEAELSLAHNFYGNVNEDVLDTFFGMDQGANVSLAFRRNFFGALELKTGYTRVQNRLEASAAWKLTPQDFPASIQVETIYQNFRQPGNDERRQNFAYMLVAQNYIYSDIAVLTLNLGYDGYYERPVNGWGISIQAWDGMQLIGEYYPVWDRDSAKDIVRQYLRDYDAYSFGIKLDTYGHHFIFVLGNAYGLSALTQSMGAANDKLHLGFRLQRRF